MTGSAGNSNHDDNSVFWKEELASVSDYLASSGSSLVFASEAKYFNSPRISLSRNSNVIMALICILSLHCVYLPKYNYLWPVHLSIYSGELPGHPLTVTYPLP